MRRTRIVCIALTGVTLAACVVQPPSPPLSLAPAEFPAPFYHQAAQAGAAVFAIDAELSRVIIEVHRGGALARLGHDHVLASHEVRGYVAPEAGRADLYIRLDQLVVDEPELRAQAGFDTQPDDAAIAGTRTNMLRLLHVEEHPYAVIGVERLDAAAANSRLRASITVNGVARVLDIPAQIEADTEQLTVRGSVALEQSQFGVIPASILGGAILVQDRIDVRFEIHARRGPA